MKTKSLKKFFATASIAAATLNCSTALASESIINNAVAATASAHFINKAGGNAEPLTAEQGVIVLAPSQLTISDATRNIPSINLYGNNLTLNVGSSSAGSTGNISNNAGSFNRIVELTGVEHKPGAIQDPKLQIIFTGTNEHTSNASNLDLLSQVDFNNVAGSFKISGNGNFESKTKFTSSGKSNGTLKVAADNLVLSNEFDKVNSISNLEIAAEKSATLNTDLYLKADQNNKGGELKLDKNSKLFVNEGKTIDIKDNAGGMGKISATSKGSGELVLAKNTIIKSDFNNANLINIISINNGPVTFNGNEFAAITTNFNATDAELILASSNNLPVNLTGNFIATNNKAGKIKANSDVILKGSIGSAENYFNDFTLSGKNLEVSQDNSHLYINSINEKGSIGIKASKFTLGGNIGSEGELVNINLISDAANAKAGSLNLANNSVIYGDINVASGANLDNTVTLTKGVVVNGNIITSNDGYGAVIISDDSRLNGSIKENAGKFVKKLEVAAGKNFYISGDLALQEAGELKLGSKSSIISEAENSVKFSLPNFITSGSSGAIIANKLGSNAVLEFTRSVGDVTKKTSLALLEATNAGIINLTKSSSIFEIKTGAAATTIKLSEANGAYFIGKTTNDNNAGNIELSDAGDITLKSGTRVGLRTLDSNSTSEEKTYTKKYISKITSKGNHKLILEDNVKIYANTLAPSDNNQRILETLGNVTIGGSVGSEKNTYNQIILRDSNFKAGSGKNVILLDSVYLDKNSGKMLITNEVKATLHGNISGQNIESADKSGVVEFANDQKVTSNIAISPDVANMLSAINISNSHVDFKKATGASKVNFTSAKRTYAAFYVPADVMQASEFTTNSSERLHNVDLYNGVQYVFDKAVGSDKNYFGGFKLHNNKIQETTIQINNKFYADILTSSDGLNKIILNADEGIVLGIGRNAAFVNNVAINNNYTIEGDVYANNMSIAAGKKVQFKGDLLSSTDKKTKSTGLVLGAGSTLEFEDNSGDRHDPNLWELDEKEIKAALEKEKSKHYSTFDIATSGAASGDGEIYIKGSAVLKSEIGKVKHNLVSLQGDAKKEVWAYANISANNIHVNSMKFNIMENITLAGNTKFTGTNLNIKDKTLALKDGQSSFNGDVTLNFTTNVDNKSYGHIEVSGAGSIFAIDSANKLEIYIKDEAELPKAEGRTYKFFQEKQGGSVTKLFPNKTPKIDSDRHDHLIYSYDVNNNELHIQNNVAGKFKKLVEEKRGNNILLRQDVEMLASMSNLSKAKLLQEDLTRFNDDEKEMQAIERIVTPNVNTGAIVSNNISRTTSYVINRLSRQTVALNVASGETGVSAGDYKVDSSAYFNPIFAGSTQKSRENTPGYGSREYGFTMGADTKASDQLTLGAAISYIRNSVKSKGAKAGDKDIINNYILNLYSMYQLTDNMHLKSGISLANARNVSKSVRITSDKAEIAKSKSSAFAYGAEAEIGYNYRLTNLTITPLLGIAIDRMHLGSYSEKGTRFSNVSVASRDYHKVDLSAGARVTLDAIAMENYDLIPEFHGGVKYDANARSPSAKVKLEGMNGTFTAKKAKANRAIYNGGLSLMAYEGDYEYGMEYDSYFAKKYVSHQGTLKLKVNF